MIETAFTAEIVIAIAFVGLAVVLGYLAQRIMGALLLGVGAAVASIFCIAGTWLGYYWREDSGAWVGLLVGIILAGLFLSRFLGNIIRGRYAGRFVAGFWFGFCALCAFGYLAAGWVGLLTITLPTLLLFWVGLYFIAGYILPLRDGSQRPQAFRSLLTFTMGSNYPYYFVNEEGSLDERVEGNPYRTLFAGPGLVYTGCDRAAYITDGVRVKGVFEPGLTFTERYDHPPKIIDLRPQLRVFAVDALTKDGIPIQVTTFVPFRIHPGDRQVEFGKSFPFRQRSIYEVVAQELVERRKGEIEDEQTYEWDGQLVPLIATPIVRAVISHYNVDELCDLAEPGRDPRVEIATEIKNKVSEALQPLGLEMVGGGIGNLMPQDESVMQRRLESWRTSWKYKIMQLVGAGEAERVRRIEMARADAEAEIILKLTRVVDESIKTGDVSHTALALRFIDSLGEIVSRSIVAPEAAEDVEGTLQHIRGEIEDGND